MQDCIFCKIVKDEISAEKIYEDEQVLAFLDINPVNYGHTLVIPKEHNQWMTDIPKDLLAKTFSTSQDLMEAVKTGTGSDFVVLSVVGVDVPHFHIHLIPRYHDDGMANFWPSKKYESGQEAKVASEIKANLKI